MDKNSLTYRTLKNISYRFIAYLWPMIFTILVTPVIVLRLGVKDYGIYIFINSIAGLTALLDLGVSYSVIKFLAEYNAQTDSDRVKRLIYSANSLFLLIGLTGLALMIAISLAGSALFPNKIGGQETYFLVLFILAGASFFVSSINSLYSLIPDALQRFDISSKLNISFLTLSALGNLGLVLAGYKLIAIFSYQLVIAIIFVIVRRIYAQRIMPMAKYHLGWDKEEIKRCYRFGFTTIINSTANTLLSYLDRLVIPIFIGPSQLTYYSLPGNVAARIPGVTDNLSGIIFPISAGIAGVGDKEKIKRFYVRSFRLITIIASAISLSVIFLAYKILLYWLSPDFAQNSTGILIVLTITNFTIALLSPITSFFFGLGRLKFSTILSLVMAGLNALLLFWLLPSYGIMGAAWAYLLSVMPIFYMVYFMEQKYLQLTGRGKYHLQTIGKLGLVAGLFFLVVKYLISPLITSLGTLAILGPLSVIIYLGLFWILRFFEPEDEKDIQRFLKLMILKFSRRGT